MTYQQIDRKAAAIMTKLRNEVNSGKVYEDQGQKELRQFKDMLAKSGLTYPEKYQLETMLIKSIEGLW